MRVNTDEVAGDMVKNGGRDTVTISTGKRSFLYNTVLGNPRRVCSLRGRI